MITSWGAKPAGSGLLRTQPAITPRSLYPAVTLVFPSVNPGAGTLMP